MRFFRKPAPTPETFHNAAAPAELPETAVKTSSSDQEKHSLDHFEGQYRNGTALEKVDPEAEKRLLRKLDIRVTLLVAVLYLFSFLDRSNIGNAETAGMKKDLKLTSDKYDWLLTIFYIAYIVFEWFALMWKIVPPHIWAAIVVTGWGIIATVQASTQNWAGMMVCRFLLGTFEAGFGPGIPYLLSFFYLRHELGFRCGLFLSAAPLATTFAGALAYGITHGHSHLANWRLLFLVEGIPTILLGVAVFFLLPDSPETARFLTEEEKTLAKSRSIRQVGEKPRFGKIEWRDVLEALKDPKNTITALMYFSCNVGFSSLPAFLPTILNQMGFTTVNAQGLTAPPYFLAFLVTVGTSWLADRLQQRGLIIITLSLIGGIGYIILAASTVTGARYFGVFLAASGIFASIGNILAWVLNNQTSDTKRGVGISMLNIVGQCGPLLGTRVFPEKDQPRYVRGMSISAAFIFFNAFLAALLRWHLARENKKLDAKYGRRDQSAKEKVGGAIENRAEGVEDSHVGEEDMGPNFRYVL